MPIAKSTKQQLLVVVTQLVVKFKFIWFIGRVHTHTHRHTDRDRDTETETTQTETETHTDTHTHR